MVRALSHRTDAVFGATLPNGWVPPAMLVLTLATYAVVLGLVFLFFIVTGPSRWLLDCLNAKALGGRNVVLWLTVANAGWAAVLVVDVGVKVASLRFRTRDKIRSVTLSFMGLIIVAGIQVAVEALRLIAAQTT